MLSIQTNVNSLVAQQNLSVTSTFQAKTIQQLTSGYRINSSSDDAAGLAVANKYRNSIAELTQGVANGNDGVASLQIMDSGMSNISMMMDRLKTLAMQSASDSFTGGVTGRATLNTEFQTDIAEIDRQAQSIGLNSGGTFARTLSVYLGAGSGSQSASNATVTVDLTKATVDSGSLGLSGYQAVRAAVTGDTTTNGLAKNYDLSDSNATTNVGAMIAGNTATGFDYKFTGAGFGDANGVTVSVLFSATAVTNTASLVSALNTAIQTAASAAGPAAQAFKAAGITASIHTDANGKEQLAFNSNHAAFQVVAAGSAAHGVLANALLGSLVNPGVATGNTLSTAGDDLVAQGSFELGTVGSTGTSGVNANTATVQGMTVALSGTQNVTISVNDSSGVAHGKTIAFDAASAAGDGSAGTSVADYLKFINTSLQGSNDASLQQITAVASANTTGTTGSVKFISTLKGFSVTVNIDGGATPGGLAATSGTASAIQVGSGGTADISTVAGAQAAVTAISQAVAALGTAQAAIGRGQNALNYGISLANSQITNFSAAESQIRDTNVAQQAANLSKAQTLSQAAIAAMAQANSAPQAVLSLLRG